MECSSSSRGTSPSPERSGSRDFDYLKLWFASRSPGGVAAGGRDVREGFEQFFTHIFNKSKDGISIHAVDFTIVGVNTTIRSWYEEGRPLVGRKCFEAYHGRSEPCENCPSQVTMRTGRPQVGVVPYQVKSGVRGDQELSVFPLFDENHQLLCVLEYVRDITSLEHDERIVESLKCRIQCQDQALLEQETALSVLLRQAHKVEQRIEEELAANVAALVMPLVARLKARCDGTEAAHDVALLEERLSEIASSHTSRLSAALRGLTSREQEVAALVNQGQSSKQIARLLCISSKAVDFHRTNIRKKLGGLRPQGSLRSVLLELEHPKEPLGPSP
jgi:DNA-binding CsgD family transcriptional regulator